MRFLSKALIKLYNEFFNHHECFSKIKMKAFSGKKVKKCTVLKTDLGEQVVYLLR